MKVLQQKIRISLKQLENLSYNVVDTDQLKEILRLTTQLEATVKDKAPSDSGLTLRPSCNSTIIARKLKFKYKQYEIWKRSRKYSSLPKPHKVGQPKSTRQRTRVKYVIDVSCS